MIRYALICDHDHAFESWFPGSTAYDEQASRGLLSCPLCGSARISKQLMAPSVTAKAEAGTALIEGQPERPIPVMSTQDAAMRDMVRAFHRHVVANTENVGDRFATEARRIHDGDGEPRAIRGAATLEDARALHEDGIAFHPLPDLPDDRN